MNQLTTITGQQPELYGTGHFVCPEQNITLICVTTGSPVVNWRSNEYIGQNRTLMLASYDREERSQHSDTIASLTQINSTTGVLESKLYIKVSPNFKNFTVSCITADLRSTTATLYVLGKSLITLHQIVFWMSGLVLRYQTYFIC